MPRQLPTPTARIGETQRAISAFHPLMPVPCTRCAHKASAAHKTHLHSRNHGDNSGANRSNKPRDNFSHNCTISPASGRCTACTLAHKPCDLRASYAEFGQLAAKRAEVAAQVGEAERELEVVESEALVVMRGVIEGVRRERERARAVRRYLGEAQGAEWGAYGRELASVEVGLLVGERGGGEGDGGSLEEEEEEEEEDVGAGISVFDGSLRRTETEKYRGFAGLGFDVLQHSGGICDPLTDSYTVWTDLGGHWAL